jgi:ferredoxin-NADP reductase
MSMLRQATKDRLPQKLLLVYANRQPGDAAFLAELKDLERQNETFRLVATVTETGDPRHPWDQQTGRIDRALIERTTADLERPIYYVAGPPGLVEAMRQTLSDAGVEDDDIRSESFHGY